jgi:hypothetical protein
MPKPPRVDPFPTVKLNVPYLKEVLELLRDPARERMIAIIHAKSREEGEWVLANTAARLQRNNIKVFGPEDVRPMNAIEQALREGAKIALIGEIKRVEDASAMRAAAGPGLSMRLVAYIAVETRKEFEDVVAELGPWRSIQPVTFTRG